MDGTVDVGTVVNGWQVLVVAIIIMGPGIAAWLTSLSAKRHAKAASDEIVHQANPNSGLSLKDSLNRIEAEQKRQGGVQVQQGERQEAQTEITRDLAGRVGSLEGAVQRQATPTGRHTAN